MRGAAGVGVSNSARSVALSTTSSLSGADASLTVLIRSPPAASGVAVAGAVGSETVALGSVIDTAAGRSNPSVTTNFPTLQPPFMAHWCCRKCPAPVTIASQTPVPRSSFEFAAFTTTPTSRSATFASISETRMSTTLPTVLRGTIGGVRP